MANDAESVTHIINSACLDLELFHYQAIFAHSKFGLADPSVANCVHVLLGHPAGDYAVPPEVVLKRSKLELMVWVIDAGLCDLPLADMPQQDTPLSLLCEMASEGIWEIRINETKKIFNVYRMHVIPDFP